MCKTDKVQVPECMHLPLINCWTNSCSYSCMMQALTCRYMGQNYLIEQEMDALQAHTDTWLCVLGSS